MAVFKFSFRLYLYSKRIRYGDGISVGATQASIVVHLDSFRTTLFFIYRSHYSSWERIIMERTKVGLRCLKGER